MNFLSRRAFCQRLSAGAGAALTTACSAPIARAADPIDRLGPSQLRLSLAAYSFREFFNHADPGRRITLAQFIDFCADHGCLGTELTSYYFPKDFTPDYLMGLKRRAFLRGLAISGTAVGNNFARPDGPELDAEIASVKRWIDHAAALGAPHIRVFAGNPKGLDKDQAIRQCARSLEACGSYAATKGVWLGLENHGGIVTEVTDLLAIIRTVQSPWVGVNLDTGNFYGQGDPYDDMARLAPYAVNVQLKVEVSRRDRGKTPTDLKRIVSLLRQARYQGYVALEYEATPDPWKAVPEWLQRMQDAFAG